MKKLLLVFMLLLSFVLLGCNNDEELQDLTDNQQAQIEVLLKRIDELEIELEATQDKPICDLLQLVKDILDNQQEGFTYTYDDNYLFEQSPYDNGIDIFNNEDLTEMYCEVQE